VIEPSAALANVYVISFRRFPPSTSQFAPAVEENKGKRYFIKYTKNSLIGDWTIRKLPESAHQQGCWLLALTVF
jgi:hypothetical protein